jgi:serine/threonine-protein kinase
VSANGTVSMAGGQGFTQLLFPAGVAVNASDGSVFVADSSPHRVRKVRHNGTVSTFAGTCTSGFSGGGALSTAAGLSNPQGVAVNAADGSLLIADTSNHRVRR